MKHHIIDLFEDNIEIEVILQAWGTVLLMHALNIVVCSYFFASEF